MKVAEENMYPLTLVHVHEHIYNSLKLVRERNRKGEIKVYAYQLSKLFSMKRLGFIS